MNEIILVEPREEHEAAVADYIAEHRAAGEQKLNGAGGLRHANSYAEWLAGIRQDSTGIPREGRYPATTFLGVRKSDGRIVGLINVRHRLTTQKALDFDGHIGSGVRPSERRRGYASQMLALALDECRKRGITRALITCNDTNLASERTILKAGGVFEDMRQEPDGTRVRRFWIDIK